MDAVIIAAGFGSRLGSIAWSKPLARVGGVTLIELALRRAMREGVCRTVVVTGHRADELERALAILEDALELPITAVRVPDWSKPNGHSVLAGAAHVAGDYLLMMADHLFGPGLLRRLASQARADTGVTLAIDRRITSPLIDPDDATFVRIDSRGHIVAIGKHLPDPDAVDCGAFLATCELAGAIEAAIAAGRPGSLTDGMQELARRGRAATMQIGDAWWIDIDDPAMHVLAEQQAPQQLADIFAGLVPVL